MSLLSAQRSLESSGTSILERLHRMLDGKNKAGMTIASKIPNWPSASAVEFPYCFSVSGTRSIIGTA